MLIRQGRATAVAPAVRRTIFTLLTCASAGSAFAGPNVLDYTSHAGPNISQAVNAVLGTGFVDSSIYVDYDNNDPFYDFTNTSATFYSVATGTAVNHAPYAVVNESVCCSKGQGDDVAQYTALYAGGAIRSNAIAIQVGGQLAAGTAPPTLETTTSSPNSTNGGTGWGTEFGLSASYLGLDTTADSWTCGEMAGFLAALKYEHPSWSWFDVKAALRQTASNWSAGYTHTAFGYGYVNWQAADLIASTGSLYLQPPGMTVANASSGGVATITLYPFRQARRAREVVYSVSPSYVWPTGRNEYTSADLAASGAVLVYTSNGTDATPTFNYNAGSNSAVVSLIAFTTDGNGNYSRVEEFSPVAVQPGSSTIGNPNCAQNPAYCE